MADRCDDTHIRFLREIRNTPWTRSFSEARPQLKRVVGQQGSFVDCPCSFKSRSAVPLVFWRRTVRVGWPGFGALNAHWPRITADSTASTADVAGSFRRGRRIYVVLSSLDCRRDYRPLRWCLGNCERSTTDGTCRRTVQPGHEAGTCRRSVQSGHEAGRRPGRVAPSPCRGP